MNTELQENYDYIRGGGSGLYEQKRGLIAVWGKEAVQFLDGLISNDMKTLEDGGQMLAAFPNAQGRLLAVVRVLRQGDRFLFETEEATREKVFQNLFRFTFAGDFFVEELSGEHSYFEIFGPKQDVLNPNVNEKWPGAILFERPHGAGYFVPVGLANEFRDFLSVENSCVVVTDELYETFRIENGIPIYGVDMDETTIVPELGIEGLISYNKGCYIGQEIIARIHFRGHVAKKLTGLAVLKPPAVGGGSTQELVNAELSTSEGKNAGRLTSVTFSPKLGKYIALAFVRFEHLLKGTELVAGEQAVTVTNLPFID